MGGVDLSDQMANYYCFARKSHKWTKKLFWFVIELMKVNSWVLCNSMAEKEISFYSILTRFAVNSIYSYVFPLSHVKLKGRHLEIILWRSIFDIASRKNPSIFPPA